jgi:hypothetical protein
LGSATSFGDQRWHVSVNTIMFLSHRVSFSPLHLRPNRK